MSDIETAHCRGLDLEQHLRPDLFKALCDPVRVSLLIRLATADAPTTVTEAASCCGVHLSGVSRHLATLREVGVLVAEKRGREVAYRVDCPRLVAMLRGLADAFEDCCGTTAAECTTETTDSKTDGERS